MKIEPLNPDKEPIMDTDKLSDADSIIAEKAIELGELCNQYKTTLMLIVQLPNRNSRICINTYNKENTSIKQFYIWCADVINQYNQSCVKLFMKVKNKENIEFYVDPLITSIQDGNKNA